MKNKLILMGVAILMATSIFAQVEDPVKWTFSTDNVNGQEAELVFSAEIDYPWHLYAAKLPSGDPLPPPPGMIILMPIPWWMRLLR